MECCCCFTIRPRVFLLLALLVALGHSASSSAYAVAVPAKVENENATKGLNTELLCSGETRREMMMKGRKMSTGGKCELGGRRKGKADQVGDGDSVSRVKLFSYLPFTSDYRGPRTHPPKNN